MIYKKCHTQNLRLFMHIGLIEFILNSILDIKIKYTFINWLRVQ